MTPAQRWQWLREAMDFGYQLARTRAARGLVTLGPQGEVLWSAAQEAHWQAQHHWASIKYLPKGNTNKAL